MSVFAAGISSYFNYRAQEEANNTNIGINRNTNVYNAEIQKAVNETNLEIARQTNASNLQIARETNELQRVESEKAYQRSTASNQIAELVRAGFSPQQAKLIVGGSGAAPSYPPAALNVPTMQAAQMQAAQMQSTSINPPMLDTNALVSAGSSLAQNVKDIASDLNSPDGGFVGYLQSENALSTVMGKIGSIDAAFLSTPEAFLSWLDNDGKNVFDEKERKVIHGAFKSVQGARSMLSQMKSFQNLFNADNVLKKQNWDIKIQMQDYRIKQLQQQFLEGQIDLQELDRSLKSMDVELRSSEIPVLLQELNVRNQQATANFELWQNDDYKAQYLAQMLANQKMLEALYTSQMYEAKYKGNVAEEAANFTDGIFGVWAGIYSVFKDLGVTDESLAGKIVANFIAISGAAISPKTTKMLREIFGDAAVDAKYNSDGSLKPAEGSSSDDNKRNFYKGINDNANQK